MKKVTGFILFWIAIGMILNLLIQNSFLAFVIIALLIILGYHLFCS